MAVSPAPVVTPDWAVQAGASSLSPSLVTDHRRHSALHSSVLRHAFRPALPIHGCGEERGARLLPVFIVTITKSETVLKIIKLNNVWAHFIL